MTMIHRVRPSAVFLAGATAILSACSPDRSAGPNLDAAPPISAQLMSQSANQFIQGSAAAPGSFGGFSANNSLRIGTEFWDNLSADKVGTEACNIGFYASGNMAADCKNPALNSTSNQGGGFTTYFGDGAGSRDGTAFMFNGNSNYTVTLRGSYAGLGSEVGWFIRNGEVYSFNPVPAWSSKTIGTTVNITPLETGGRPWGFYIKNTFNPSAGGCAGPDVDCSDAENGFGGPEFQQFALFSNAAGRTFLVGAEDNRLELMPNGNFEDSDYNDYIWSIAATAPPCDFMTFGRTQIDGTSGEKIVISGNAGGNSPKGGFLGNFLVKVGAVDYNLKDIVSYGQILSGVFSGASYPNARVIVGRTSDGTLVELRIYDGGEPGRVADAVYVKIGSSTPLGAAGANLDRGNIQYHATCRGPKT